MPREHSSTGIAIVTKPEDFEQAAQTLFGLPLQQALSMWTYKVPQERTPTYEPELV